jgi:two-component system, NtrC family, response regulator AtoC
LRNKRFVRPGNGTPVEVDVRILAASTTSVESALAENKLREELYYYLSAYTIHVPPLRQRREEIPVLLRHFMQHLAKRYGLSPRTFPTGVMQACQSHAWPGNMRELESFVKRYLMAGEKVLAFGGYNSEPDDGAHYETATTPPVRPSPPRASPQQGSVSGQNSLKSVVQNVKLEAERNAIAAALESTGWNRKAAARLLKVSYRTLLYKIELYRMRPPGVSDSSSFHGFKSNGNGIL